MTHRAQQALRSPRPTEGQLAARDILWFQATYNLAAAYIQCDLEREERGELASELPSATLWARLLVRDLEQALKFIDSKTGSLDPQDEARRAELTAVEGPALVLLAGLHSRRLDGRGVTLDDPVPPLDRDGVIAAAEAEAEAEKYLPQDLVQGFLLNDPARVSYRARFNLACYYSALAAMSQVEVDPDRLLRQALLELRYAVETGDLVDLAIADLALQELREKKAPEFWATLGRERPAQLAGVLGRVRCIGPSFAGRLAREGISTPSELAERAGNEQDARVLADAVGARSELVKRWGQLAWMMTHLESVGIDGVNLLDEARVDSVKALSRFNPLALTRLIAGINEAFSIVGSPPQYAEVARWIRQAKTHT